MTYFQLLADEGLDYPANRQQAGSDRRFPPSQGCRRPAISIPGRSADPKFRREINVRRGAEKFNKINGENPLTEMP